MKRKDLKNISSKFEVANPSRVGNPKLLESISIKNRKFQNLSYHNERLNHSRRSIFGIKDQLNIREKVAIPPEISSDIHKCRIIYSIQIETIEFEKYYLRPIRSLKLIEADNITYGFKYADRGALNELFRKKGDHDDILIVKNGHLTDSSYANVIFWDNSNWYTPSNPLLRGTKRRKLLHEGIITELEIKVEDLGKFSKARIINALIDLEESPDISINNISF